MQPRPTHTAADLPTGVALDDLRQFARMVGLPLRDVADLTEIERVDLIHAVSAMPGDLADVIPAAPARGAFRTYPVMNMVEDGRGNYRLRKTQGAAVMDAFDRMAAASARSGGTCGLSLSQVSMARRYGALVTSLRDGVAPRSCLDMTPRGGSSLSFLEVRLEWSREVTMLQNRVGDGVARAVRRIRPSARGSRVAILDRVLLDLVAVQDMTVSDVLRAHGWARDDRTVRDLTAALADICDRMMGPTFRRRLSACHYGALPAWPAPEVPE